MIRPHVIFPRLRLPGLMETARGALDAVLMRLRQRPDETLLASEAHLREVIDGVSESLAVIDRRGTILQVNQSWRNFSRQNGVEAGKPTPRTGLGTNYLEVCETSARRGCESSAQALAGIRAVLNGRLPDFSLEYACDSPDQPRWFSMRVTPLDGGRGGAVIAHVNVSKHKLAEDTLREQEEFFRLIAENLDGFVAVLDLDGRRMYNSPSYAKLLGNRNLAGSLSFADVHPADRERVIQAFREIVASGTGRRLEYRLLTIDGVRLLESCSGVVRDPEGRSQRVVVVSHDITERRKYEQRLHHLAFHDTLTHLPNRSVLDGRLRQAMAASQQSGFYGALMFVDLDNFKPLNDRHGHATGDRLLIEVAARLTACVRARDVVARFGGDEFVVMLSDLDVDRAESTRLARRIAEKIRRALAQPYLFTLARAEDAGPPLCHRCTASIGVSLFVGHDISPNVLFKRADSAMYQAKSAGRNLIRFDDPQEGEAIRDSA
jgi:diguanylate cyclase (GGDEF)-like protein/PAS domain S-box-containing protein